MGIILSRSVDAEAVALWLMMKMTATIDMIMGLYCFDHEFFETREFMTSSLFEQSNVRLAASRMNPSKQLGGYSVVVRR